MSGTMMEKSTEIKEGFLCPVCHIDLGTAVNLMSHFDDKHSEDQVILKPLKGILGKAKKILNKDSSSSTSQTSAENSQTSVLKSTLGYEPTTLSEQDLGVTTSHTQYFKTFRNVRVEKCAVQTNQLLYRLQKLLHNLPSDPVKRKAHEQEVVPWVMEKEVRLCPGCAKPFGLLRRKHHCRLCGGVMCNDCTFLLPLENARRMIDVIETESSTQTQKLVKSTSTSVQSVLSIDQTTDSHVRLCEYCNNCLQSREKLREGRMQKPIICQFYNRLTAYMSEADESLKAYKKINKSLRSGETFHSVREAQNLREKLVKLAENIDTTSKKIAVLGQSTDSPPQGVQLQLQKTVRVAAMNYFNDKLVGLPSVPTREQLYQIQEEQRLEIAKRLDEEERKTAEALQKTSLSSITRNLTEKLPKNSNTPRSSATPRQPKIVIESGWTPGQAQSNPVSTLHPLIQQMNIVRGYIKQAELVNKTEEVQMLQANLRQLKEEYYKQCQEE